MQPYCLVQRCLWCVSGLFFLALNLLGNGVEECGKYKTAKAFYRLYCRMGVPQKPHYGEPSYSPRIPDAREEKFIPEEVRQYDQECENANRNFNSQFVSLSALGKVVDGQGVVDLIVQMTQQNLRDCSFELDGTQFLCRLEQTGEHSFTFNAYTAFIPRHQAEHCFQAVGTCMRNLAGREGKCQQSESSVAFRYHFPENSSVRRAALTISFRRFSWVTREWHRSSKEWKEKSHYRESPFLQVTLRLRFEQPDSQVSSWQNEGRKEQEAKQRRPVITDNGYLPQEKTASIPIKESITNQKIEKSIDEFSSEKSSATAIPSSEIIKPKDEIVLRMSPKTAFWLTSVLLVVSAFVAYRIAQ